MIGDWRLETGDWRLETGDWRVEMKKYMRAFLLAVLVMTTVYLYGLRIEDFKAACAGIADGHPFTIHAPVWGSWDCIIIEKVIYFPYENE